MLRSGLRWDGLGARRREMEANQPFAGNTMTAELRGSAAGFFSAAAFSEFCTAAGADGFGAGGVSRRVGFSTESGRAAGCTAAVAADDEESERWPRIFGSATTATITRKAAAA